MTVEVREKRDTMEMYDAFKWPSSVPVKEWDDLTEDQKKVFLDAYRFSGFKPGTYQGVTFSGPGGMMD